MLIRKKEKVRQTLSRNEKVERWTYFFVLISFLIPIAFLVIRIIFSGSPQPEGAIRSQADYVLMLLQCLLGVIVIHLPTMMERKFRFDMPTALYVMYILFLYCAIFLGEVRNFYYEVPHWDTILHGFSAAMAGAFGFILVALLNRNTHTPVSLSPFFVALFAFCFAVMIGTVWEIYEYAADGLFGLNMQHFQTEAAVPLEGRDALLDTMKDIIVDMAGALLVSICGYFSLKQKRGWISELFKKRMKSEEADQMVEIV